MVAGAQWGWPDLSMACMTTAKSADGPGHATGFRESVPTPFVRTLTPYLGVASRCLVEDYTTGSANAST